MTAGPAGRSTEDPVRILLVDGPDRDEVTELLADEASLEVVAEAARADEALAEAAGLAADVALVGAPFDGDGLDLCRALRSLRPELRCLILSARTDEDALYDAIMAGASGLVPRQGAELVHAVRVVGTGGSLLDPRTTAGLIDRLRREREAAAGLAGLTEEERAVFVLLGQGLTNREISRVLRVSDKVVKGHVSHLLGKLGLQRRPQLVALSARLRAEGEL